MNFKFAVGEIVSYPAAGPAPYKVPWRMPARMTLCKLYGIKSDAEENERTVLETDLVAIPKKVSMSETVPRMVRYPHSYH